MSTAPRYIPHYSAEDYQRWEGDWELWYGVAVAMSPAPFGPHELVVSRLNYLFRYDIDRRKCQCEVYAGLDWVVNADTVVRPDVMIVCGDQPPRHLERPPVLAVEVLSPSTASKDRLQKRDLYQLYGVSHYLIVDPELKTLQVLNLAEDGYLEILHSERYRFRLCDDCEIELETSRLFDAS